MMDRSNFVGAWRMLFDPGAKRAASPALWCAAAALAVVLGLGGTARAQDDIDNETPIVAAPVPDAPPPIKKHHHKRRPPPDDDSAALGPAGAPPAPAPVATAVPVPPAPGTIVAPPPPSPARVGLPPGPAPAPSTPAALVTPPPAPAATPATPPAGTAAQELDSEPWSAAVLLGRLCSDTLRHNEEDRLDGLVSFTVRATLSYDKQKFTASEIDDTVQDGIDALIKACPRIEATNRAYRLGFVIDTIQNLALQRMEAHKHPASRAARLAAGDAPPALPPQSAQDRRLARRAAKPLGPPNAADLSQELTSAEIDAWLDGLPPMQRALALFQYASDVTPPEEEAALGIAPTVLRKDATAAKNNLMSFFDEDEEGAPNAAPSPPIQYREAGTQVAKLLEVSAPAAGPPTPSDPSAPPGPTLTITGISADLDAGWSLLAIATGLPPDKGLDIVAPVMLAVGEGDKERRVLVVAADEITKPDAPIRRYLLKAYAIDGDGQGVGFHDALRLVPGGINNAGAEKTLRVPGLANIEIARCLWHDYGTGPDPGLCR
jgi:DNA-directed RNA polymerase specialized sigma24 family protein